MTLLQLFYRFLKQNNLFHLYKKNMNNKIIQDDKRWYDINNINNVRAFSLLSNAFDWEETNENFNFWFIQSTKWKKIIHEYYDSIESNKKASYYYEVKAHEKVISPNDFIKLINKHLYLHTTLHDIPIFN